MKALKLCLLAVLPAAMVLASCGDDSSHKPPKDTAALDIAKKIADFKGDHDNVFPSSGFGNGGNFNVEWSASEAQVKEDKLHLTISPNGEGREYPWKGGEIRSYDFYGYGDFGTRMKPSNTPGTASTFFTYTGEWDSETLHPSTGKSDTRNPDNPEGVHDEIDIEFLGKDTTKVQFNYFTNGKGGHEYMYDLGFDASKEFHDYGFRWEKERIIWFVDGNPVYMATEDIPTHPGRILANYWCGTGSSVGWMGRYDHTKASESVYEWFSGNMTGTHTNKEDPTPGPQPEPGDWDDIDPTEFVLAACDDDYDLTFSDDNMSVEVSYENLPAVSYKNFSFTLPESAKAGDVLCFEIENLAQTTAQVRVDVNAATPHGPNNITAINTSSTFKGESLYTDTSWGGSKTDISGGDKGLFEVVYDGEAVNLMFMIDSAIYQDGAASHSGHLKISNLKIADAGEDPEPQPGEALVLPFTSQGPYTAVVDEEKTTITYESVQDNSYANVVANIADLLGDDDNCLVFDLKNNGAENVQINVKIGAYGETGMNSRLVAFEEYDYFGENDRLAQYNIGAGQTRICAFVFDRLAEVSVIEMCINSGWAATTTTHTNGNIEISEAGFTSIVDDSAVLPFASQGPYTCVVADGKTTITYESVQDNSYANVVANIADLLGDDDNCLVFDLKNNGAENVQINVKIGAYGETGMNSRLVAIEEYDYFGENDRLAQYNIGAGQTRTCAFVFDRLAEVSVIEMCINSGWAATTSTHTNGDMEIFDVSFATAN